jgi:hypothetical protein
MRTLPTLVLVAILAGCASNPQPAPDAFMPIASVRQIMEAIIVPSSDRIWAAGSEAPESGEQWLQIEHAALALAESGNLLLIEGRAPTDEPEWIAQTVAMARGAQRAADAARNRNIDSLLTAGDAIYESCAGCHSAFMDGNDAPR